MTIGNSYTHEKYIAKDFVNNRALFNEKRFPLYEFRILNRGLECYLSSSCNGIEPAPFSMLNLDLLGKIFVKLKTGNMNFVFMLAIRS